MKSRPAAVAILLASLTVACSSASTKSQTEDTFTPAGTSASSETTSASTSPPTVAPTLPPSTITTIPPEPGCPIGETAQWNGTEWDCRRPKLPKCELKGYITSWDRAAGEWEECRRPPGPGCLKGETAEWREAIGRWRCQRPPKPDCPNKGERTVWKWPSGAWSECERPPALRCSEEYPVSHWNPQEGEWGCWGSCGDGGESYTKSTGELACRSLCDDGDIRILDTEKEGYVWCYPPCDSDYERYYTSDNLPSCRYVCGEQEVRVFQAETGSVWCLDEEPCPESLLMKIIADTGPICIPTPETETLFWMSAFSDAGLDSSRQAGKWIGGLVATYFHPVFYSPDEAEFWETELGHYRQGEWAQQSFINTWEQESSQTFTAFIAEVRRGMKHVDICYGHDCQRQYNCPDNECGLIGSSKTGSACRAYLWETQKGLYFLMSVDAGSPLCLDAYNKIHNQTMNQASLGTGSCQGTQTVGSKEHKGVQYPVIQTDGCSLEEITLTDTGRDNTTWTTAKDYG